MRPVSVLTQSDFNLLVSNAFHSVSISQWTCVLLTGSPVLISIPEDQTVLEDDVVTFRCIADGNPFPSVAWTFNDTTLLNGDKYQIETSGSEFGLLRIMNTTFDDRGTYTCTFNNSLDSASATVRLTVQGKITALLCSLAASMLFVLQ